MADIFDEVTEDLKKDQYKEFWNKHKLKIIFLFSLFILTIVGYKTAQYHFLQKKIAVSNQFFEAIQKIESNKINEGEGMLQEISSDSNTGYALLSLFKLADLSFEKKDYLLMEKYYNEIINKKNINEFYKDYALILKIKKSPNFNNSDKLKHLKPILNSPNELQPIVAELEILLLLNDNQIKKAKSKLSELIKRNDISNSQKNRLNVVNEIYFN